MMSLHANHAGNGNQPLQPTPVPHVRLAWNLACRYSRPLGADPLEHITRRIDTRGLAASHRFFSDEIRAKYALGEMQKPWTNSMVYRILGTALSVIYHNIRMTVPLSFTIIPTITIPSPALSVFQQTSTAFPMMVKDRWRFTPNLLEPQAGRAAHSTPFAARADAQPQPRQPAFGTAHPYPAIPNVLAAMTPSTTQRPVSLQQPVDKPMLDTHPLMYLATIPSVLRQAITVGAQGYAPASVVPDMSPQRLLLPRFHTPSTPGQHYGHHVLPQVAARQANRPQSADGWQPVTEHALRSTFDTHQAELDGFRLTPQGSLSSLAPRRAATPWLGAWSMPRFAANITGRTDPIVATKITDDRHRFSVIRREEPFEPPRLSYPLVQPPVTQKAQVVTTVREQEVVNVVRNEIHSYMASSSPLKQFSRSDYAHIADHVYSSLTRRLLVEKERLGLR
jgi:hypothetical protein